MNNIGMCKKMLFNDYYYDENPNTVVIALYEEEREKVYDRLKNSRDH